MRHLGIGAVARYTPNGMEEENIYAIITHLGKKGSFFLYFFVGNYF